jgi:diguanylate cyclase (GGDEF)-like protein/PAS domain S-box-containing protein
MPNQAKANLSALIESTEDLIWSVDLDYRLITFNRALRQNFWATFGVQLETGMRLHEQLPPERAVLWPPYYERVLREGPFRVEYTLLSSRILELSFNPIVADRVTTGISVFGKDITERKAAESALREAEKKYRSIFDGALEGIFQASLEGQSLAANPALARMLGYDSPQELDSSIDDLGKDVWVDPDERTRYLQLVKEQGDKPVLGYECRFKCKDGSVIWVSLSGRLVFKADGTPLRSEGFIVDITGRKRAEESLRESGDFLKEAQMLGFLGCYVLDISSGVWTSSDVLDGIFGIGKEYARTVEGWTALVHPHDSAMMADYFQNEVVAQGKPFDKEYRIIRQTDQAERWVHGTGSLEFDAQGRPLKMHGIIQDITEPRLAQMKLRDSVLRYRTVFQTVPDAVIIARVADGMIIDANQAFLDSSMFERNEVVGRTALELGIWVDPSDLQKLLDALIRTGECRDLEVRSRRKNGEIFWMRLSASLIEIGGVQCRITFAKDISETKAAEERLADAANALRSSEERYRTVFLMNIDSIDICHLEDGRFIDVNEAFLACTGFEREEVIGRTAVELGIWANPGDRKILVDAIRHNSECRNLEAPYRTKDGRLRWGLLSVTAIELDGVPCILSVTRDITEAKAAEQRLAAAQVALGASEERYRATFQSSIDAININRLSDGVFVDVNEAFLRFVGYERDEVIGRTSRELNFWVDPEDRQRMIESLRRNGSCRDLQARFRRKNGDIVWGQLSESIIEADGVPCILSVTRDVSAAKAAEEQIRDLAFYDPLTHLPNRSLLMERLRQSLAASSRNNRKRALLFVDLDNFKILNDTLGHRTGDLMLQEVAVRLAACIREADSVARLGGDEFVVMLEDLSDVPEDAAAQAEVVGEKILAAINQPFWLAGRECLSTSSIGITVFGDKRESTDEVLQQADIAMYQAKAAGRNTMRFFAPALQAAVNARAVLEEDIRQAIKASQFVLYYQPQLDSIGLVGAEALIRWNHPRRGLLLPGEFIPLAEETGLIQALGDWVLETACAQVAAWADRPETAHISLAINISARQFRQPGFVDKVLEALNRTGANPQNIKLELTESMLVENIEDIIAKMTLLKSHGLKFSLDDFGTGYSSLAYLKRLPIDQLKIDSSFVRDIVVDIGSRAIAQSVISLSRALGLSVIAECVETEEQRAFLSRLGCHAFQGFLFGPPLPLAEFERLWLPSAAYPVSAAG